MNKIIFAGPMIHKNEFGGIVVLFEDLANDVRVRHVVLDTNCKNYYFCILMIIKFIYVCLFASLMKDEISLHGTENDFKYLGILLVVFNKIFGLKYHCRKFAGDFDLIYLSMPKFWKSVVVKLLSNSKVNYFETKNLVDFFLRFNANTRWLPNYRSSSPFRTPSHFDGRFVFIGHVKKEKGIDAILALHRFLPHSWVVDVYGPLIDYLEHDFCHPNIRYCGIVDSQDVAQTLSRYNALLIPTYHDGEGYPGVIIEAYSVALPVVATNWRSIPEIVDKTCGILIEPKNVESLAVGLREVEKEYFKLQAGAFSRFKDFDRDIIVGRYFKDIGITAQL